MNVLENFLAGRQARREQDAAAQQNAMNGFLQQNGQALFSGDQNALGQLAGMGPEGLQSAFSIRGQQQQDQRAQRQDARADVTDQREEWRYQKEVEQYAAGISAQEAATQADKIEKSIKTALMAQTPEQFDALVTQMGQPDLVGQFDNRDAIAAQYMPMADILKQRAGPAWRPATVDEAAQYGAAGGQIDTESGKFDPINPPKGMEITSDGRGGFTLREGSGVGGGDKMKPSDPALMLDTIDGILADPALDTSTGILSPLQAIPGTPMKRFQGRANQLNGQAFLQAFESLKGAGQITEIEGAKATQAIGRLDTAQAPADYRAALQELRGIITLAQGRPEGWAEQQNGQTPPPAPLVDVAPSASPSLSPEAMKYLGLDK